MELEKYSEAIIDFDTFIELKKNDPQSQVFPFLEF